MISYLACPSSGLQQVTVCTHVASQHRWRERECVTWHIKQRAEGPGHLTGLEFVPKAHVDKVDEARLGPRLGLGLGLGPKQTNQQTAHLLLRRLDEGNVLVHVLCIGCGDGGLVVKRDACSRRAWAQAHVNSDAASTPKNKREKKKARA